VRAAATRAPRSGRRRRRWAVGLLLGAALAAVGATAQAIAFTVQVIAVSDQTAALDISRGLLRDGFPAYVVRSTGGQGDVYRVRVGAFANRAAAVRYAATMPDVAGARPVPALAEAIPGGIMPLAPRVLWEGPIAGADLRVLPWPEGIALRRQVLDPLRQATYTLVQGAEVRTVEAWLLAPLAELPASPGLAPDVPFIDLTVEGAPDGGAAQPPAPAEDEATAPAEAETEGPPPGEPPPGEPPPVAPPPPEPAPREAPPAEPAPPEPPPAEPAPAEPERSGDDGVAQAPGGEVEGLEGALAEGVAEAGLVMLRDRSLWPPGWADDDDDVREAFRAATLALVSGRLEIAVEAVAATAYLPTGEPPPALVVVELSDRSGRDAGDIRGLGDPTEGLRPEGPPPLAGSGTGWWPEADLGTTIALDRAADAPMGGQDWTLENDAGFVRIVTAGGADWRAIAGVLLWSDGRYALVRDRDDLVLVDFTVR